MFRFVNTSNVIRNILGWSDLKRQRLFVVAGEKDALMGVTFMRQMAVAYEKAVEQVLGALFGKGSEMEEEKEGRGVAFEIVSGSGRHFQNDLYWEEASAKIGQFLEQLQGLALSNILEFARSACSVKLRPSGEIFGSSNAAPDTQALIIEFLP